jgi:hypothetical protein
VCLGWLFFKFRVGIDGLHGFLGELPKFVLLGQRTDRAEGVQLEKEFMVQADLDVATGNPQVFKAAANQNDSRFASCIFVFRIVNGRKAPHDAIGGNDIEDVKTFDGGCDLRGMSHPRLALRVFHFHLAALHVGVPSLQGDEIVEPEMIDAGVADASDTRQDGGRMHFDNPLERPPELPA